MYLSKSRNADAHFVVIFIPHAGGCGETYMPWFRYFPVEVDCRFLQLPARGLRINETMPDSIDRLTDDILDEIRSLFDRQLVFFGHSMGALIAFELVRKMERNWHTLAHALFVSGCRAPSEPSKHHLSGEGDIQFIAQLANYGGLDNALLEQPALMQLFLPALRQDIALCENYICPEQELLQTPLHVLWGTEDDLITRTMIDAWRKYSSEENIHFHPHRGDHFYHLKKSQSLISAIKKVLSL